MNIKSLCQGIVVTENKYEVTIPKNTLLCSLETIYKESILCFISKEDYNTIKENGAELFFVHGVYEFQEKKKVVHYNIPMSVLDVTELKFSKEESFTVPIFYITHVEV